MPTDSEINRVTWSIFATVDISIGIALIVYLHKRWKKFITGVKLLLAGIVFLLLIPSFYFFSEHIWFGRPFDITRILNIFFYIDNYYFYGHLLLIGCILVLSGIVVLVKVSIMRKKRNTGVVEIADDLSQDRNERK